MSAFPTREEIIQNNPLEVFVQRRGMVLKRAGKELYGLCPFHADGGRPNFRIDTDKQTWCCDVCGKGVGGSVIDFVMRTDNVSNVEAMKRLAGNGNGHSDKTEVAWYDYTDENGRLLYQVVRFVPKTFRQRHKDQSGEWKWNMEGVNRVLYHLPEVIKAEQVFVTEGEKDADALRALGFTATTNVGGAGKWLPTYSEVLKGKSVVVWQDNDKPDAKTGKSAGKEHADKVVESLVKSKFVRLLVTPEKDAADFIKANGDGAKREIEKLVKATEPLNLAGGVPVKDFMEMELSYQEFVKRSDGRTFNLGKWLPSFYKCTRPLVAGELVAILADTGHGKTAILSSLALAARPLPTLMFELELPEPLMFERFLQQDQGFSGREIFDSYRNGTALEWKHTPDMKHLFFNTQSRLKVEDIERIVNVSEVKIGQRPAVVIVDYIGLVKPAETSRSRYERLSDIAEDLKVVAKQTDTILIFTSQVARDKNRKDAEVFLHDGKDSGSIENSAGLVLGAWRCGDKGETMKIKVMKNTRGRSGIVIDCNFIGHSMQINEQASNVGEEEEA